jgi:hypothetical protein
VAGVVALWGLAMAALFVPYMVFSPSSGHEFSECYGYLPTLAGWVTGPPGSRWEQTLAAYSRPEFAECKLFSGFGVFALLLGAVAGLPFLRRRGDPVLYLVVAGGLFAAALWWGLTISRGPGGDSVWWWVRHLPGGKAVRVVSRVYVVVYLFGTLAGLAWLELVARRIRHLQLRGALLAAVASVVIAEQTGLDPFSFERKEFYPLVDRAAADLRGAEAGYLAPRYDDSAGVRGEGPYGEVFAMWVGLRANVPVINAYSGVLPPGAHSYETMTDEQIRAWLAGRYRGKVRCVDPLRPGRSREVVVE